MSTDIVEQEQSLGKLINIVALPTRVQINIRDQWMASAPTQPQVGRPTLREPMPIFGIGIPLTMMGVSVGFLAMLTIPDIVVGLIVFAVLSIVPGVVMPVAVVMVVGWWRTLQFKRLMKSSGWEKYDAEHRAWFVRTSGVIELLASADNHILNDQLRYVRKSLRS